MSVSTLPNCLVEGVAAVLCSLSSLPVWWTVCLSGCGDVTVAQSVITSRRVCVRVLNCILYVSVRVLLSDRCKFSSINAAC